MLSRLYHSHTMMSMCLKEKKVLKQLLSVMSNQIKHLLIKYSEWNFTKQSWAKRSIEFYIKIFMWQTTAVCVFGFTQHYRNTVESASGRLLHDK